MSSTHRRRGLAAEMDSVGGEPARWHARTDRRPIRQHQFGIVAAAQHRIALAIALGVARSAGLAIGQPDDMCDALPAGLGDHHVDCRADTELAGRRIVVAGGDHQGRSYCPARARSTVIAFVGADPGGIRQLVVISRRQPALSRMNEWRAASAARPAALYGWARPVEHRVADQQRLHRAAAAAVGVGVGVRKCGDGRAVVRDHDTRHVLKKPTGHAA